MSVGSFFIFIPLSLPLSALTTSYTSTHRRQSQLQGRIARAEALVREQLAVRETASMWAALGDLTQVWMCVHVDAYA